MNTLFAKCIICQCDRNENLKKAKDSSISKFVSALTLRKDEVYQRLCPEMTNLHNTDVVWHNSCYATYSSQQNIKYASGVLESPHVVVEDEHEGCAISSSSLRISRSVVSPMDWSKCLFCNNKTHKKVKEMQNVTEYLRGV